MKSPTSVKPVSSSSSRLITVTGLADSISARRIREPVTEIFSTASSAASSCASAALGATVAAEAIPKAQASLTDLASLEFVNMYCLPGPLNFLVCV